MHFFSVALAAGDATSAAQPSMIENLIPFVFVFGIMYFLVIRPQAKKAKDHMSLLQTLKAGDEVVTSGGIIGHIRSVADDFVTLDLGSTTVKVLKENVVRGTKQPQPAAKKTIKPAK